MVTVGLAITVEPVVVFNPVAGDQAYVLAPLATNVTESPKHRFVRAGLTVRGGAGLTLMTATATFWQPLASEPVTV